MRAWVFRHRLAVVQVVLAALLVLLAVALASYGAVQFVADALARRQPPVQRFTSPDERWQVSVYEVERAGKNPGFWVATVARAGDTPGAERVIWRGREASFSWVDRQVLVVSESTYPMVERERLDVVAVASLLPWQGRGSLAAFAALVPGLVLLFGWPVVWVFSPPLVERLWGS